MINVSNLKSHIEFQLVMLITIPRYSESNDQEKMLFNKTCIIIRKHIYLEGIDVDSSVENKEARLM